MNFNFKKIASAASSALMIGSTVALAAAANYPAPFVSGSSADVAIIVGDSATADLTAAAALSADLSTRFVAGGGRTTTTTTIDGENYPLFTSSSELFLNSTLTAARDTLTDQQLPTILADGTVEGATSYGYEQRIYLGANPQITFAAMPDDDNDPRIGISFSTTPSTTPLYNASVIFDEATNFTHADTTGEEIELFGQKFTVGGGTTTTKLVLLKSAQTVDLSSDVTPSASVTVEGNAYTVELIAATDSSATIKVTDSAGKTDSKEINEDSSKSIVGVEVSVTLADENNNRNTATVSVGSNKITLQDGSNVKIGTDDDIIDGTNVEFTGGLYTGNLTRIDFQVSAPASSSDAIYEGMPFVDPIFGSFSVVFSEISAPLDSTDDREMIDVSNSGNDKMTVKFQSHDGSDPVSVYYVYNKTTAEGQTENAGLGGQILADSDGDALRVVEGGLVNKSQYFVFASDTEGGLYELTRVYNSSSTTASDDEIIVRNVLTGEETTAKATAEGTGSLTVQGKTYTFLYTGTHDSSEASRQVRFNNPESSSNDVILFPTVKTSKGAKIAFYQPTLIDLENFNGLTTTSRAGNITSLLLPDGDGYTDIDVARDSGGGAINGGGVWNFTFGSTTRNINTSLGAGSSGLLTVGKLTYNVSGFAAATTNHTVLYLQNPEGGNVARPALIILEERDDGSNYEAMIVTTDAGYDGDSAGIGVADVVRTWGSDVNLGNEIQLRETDDESYRDMDWWGSLITLDKSDSDQTTAAISYPDDQVEAMVYVAEADASVVGGTSGALGDIVYDASEVSSVSNKNLIVLGGSCINTVAASLLGSSSPLCGADFTAETQVGSGSFLISSYASPYNANKIALLVAGYDAADTINAANALKSNTVDTTANKKYTGTTATSLTPVL